jgi:predicted  nucleic acid-binding Zn-ribbon protein
MSTVSEKIEEGILIRLLLERQPHSKDMLEFLHKHFTKKGGHGTFAPIKGERCGVCHLSIAHARLQQAKNGLFISCANCSRFLYWPEALLAKDEPA